MNAIDLEAIQAEVFAEMKKSFTKFMNHVDEISSREFAMQTTNAMKMVAEVLNELAYSDEFENELTKLMGDLKAEIDIAYDAFEHAENIQEFQKTHREEFLKSLREGLRNDSLAKYDIIGNMIRKAWRKTAVQRIWHNMKSWFRFRFE